ncbi:CoA ester lyase [Actinophytocola sp.]|uniref:HpcH/HpaI aldolase/citrate lyase family protein n=1 Tax=Actinophytocola sp. TaxID=1872138 RepID=UPI002ED3DFEB
MFTRYCRSVLCTPAIAPDRYASCHSSGADIRVVDLEDSVPAHRKEEARHTAARFFSTAPQDTTARCAIRVNAVTEPDGLADLLALRHYPVKPAIVQIPKVESARDVEIVEQVLGGDCPRLELFAVIETPRGVERLREIATASPRLRALIFGAADYAMELGVGLEWEPLAQVRSLVVNSARAAGLHAIDAPTFELTDLPLAHRESTLARRAGFSGKIALHPRQVPVLHEVFSPDAEQLALARRIVAAAETSGESVTTVAGTMVGRPFFTASRRLLDEFGPVPVLTSQEGDR